MKSNLYLPLFCTLIFFAGCKKSKIKKQFAGKWEVTTMYSDETNFLLIKQKGELKLNGCDTIHFERQQILKSEITFNDEGNYIRVSNITIKYIDTAASRIQCAAVYGDSLLNSTEEGTWLFEGKETVELLASNNNYEGNKLITISNNEMEWRTDLTVEQGFLVFKGLKTTKFIKR